jgi:hypothetical protein
MGFSLSRTHHKISIIVPYPAQEPMKLPHRWSVRVLPVQLLLTSLITDIPLITIASDRVENRDILWPQM